MSKKHKKQKETRLFMLLGISFVLIGLLYFFSS